MANKAAESEKMTMALIGKYPWILAVALVLALAEYAWRRSRGRQYDLAQAATSLGVALGQALIRPFSLIVTIAILTFFAGFAPWHVPMDRAWGWVLGFFAVEFAYYWFHRLSHEVAWMWATHRVHHSATEMVLPAAIRLGWTELLSGGWVPFVPLVLLGFSPAMVGVLLGVGLIYQYGLHTEAPIRLGPLEWVLNSPSHHRVHHSRDAEFLDCNYGSMLIVFDRLFGTFRSAPQGAKLQFGLVHGGNSANPFVVALGGWHDLFSRLAEKRGLRERLSIAFGRPR